MKEWIPFHPEGRIWLYGGCTVMPFEGRWVVSSQGMVVYLASDIGDAARAAARIEKAWDDLAALGSSLTECL